MQLIKLDVETKLEIEWSTENCSPMEPMFVPRPGASEEDDGEMFNNPVLFFRFTLDIQSSRHGVVFKSHNLLAVHFTDLSLSACLGVVLAPVINSNPGESDFLVVLDGKSFQEMARASVNVEMHIDMHGFFIPQHDEDPLPADCTVKESSTRC